MKYMIRFTAIVFAFTLASCGTTETGVPIIPNSDTTLLDSVYTANQAYQDSIIAKIGSVKDLLDTLENFEPKMTH